MACSGLIGLNGRDRTRDLFESKSGGLLLPSVQLR